jgi:preprotein translocase subunit SecE
MCWKCVVRATARQAGKEKQTKFVSSWTRIIIWAAIIGAVFAYLWWQGQIRRLADYIRETREELKKCSWPTWDELKGSTAVIAISIALLGGFVYVVDRIFFTVLFQL